MDDNFSPRVKDVISYSKEEALRLGHNSIGTEHLMLGILRDGSGKAVSILKSIEVDLDELRRKVEILNPAVIENSATINNKKNLHLTRQAERALKTTFLEAKLFQSDIINTVHLLLCILRNENDPTTKLLLKLNIDYDVDPNFIKENLNGTVIQGGLDPKILLKDKSEIKEQVDKYLNIFSNYPYVFNLGHGVLPETKPEIIEYVINLIKNKK